MNRLRDSLDQARVDYQQARYPGDLGALAVGGAARPWRAVAIAAGLLVAAGVIAAAMTMVLRPGDPTPPPTPVAANPPTPTHGPRPRRLGRAPAESPRPTSR